MPSVHPHSETMHLVERFRRRDFGYMDLALTVDNPTWFTRPFTVNVRYPLLPDNNVPESVCAENEKELVHRKHSDETAGRHGVVDAVDVHPVRSVSGDPLVDGNELIRRRPSGATSYWNHARFGATIRVRNRARGRPAVP